MTFLLSVVVILSLLLAAWSIWESSSELNFNYRVGLLVEFFVEMLLLWGLAFAVYLGASLWKSP